MSNIEKCVRCGAEYHYESEHMCEDLQTRYTVTSVTHISEGMVINPGLPPRRPLMLTAVLATALGSMGLAPMPPRVIPNNHRRHTRNSMKHSRAGGWTPKKERNRKGRK